MEKPHFLFFFFFLFLSLPGLVQSFKNRACSHNSTSVVWLEIRCRYTWNTHSKSTVDSKMNTTICVHILLVTFHWCGSSILFARVLLFSFLQRNWQVHPETGEILHVKLSSCITAWIDAITVSTINNVIIILVTVLCAFYVWEDTVPNFP